MLRSFIDVDPDSHFPIQNLPYGAFITDQGEIHLCTAIGDLVVDLFVLDEEGLFGGPELSGQMAFQDSSLNYFMSMSKDAWTEARSTLQTLLSADGPTLRDDEVLKNKIFHKQSDVQLVFPVEVGDYTDFYSSQQHARNVGAMFRDPENALLPNWKHLPVAYHGRASSIVISGTDLHRPKGQILPENSETPIFSESKRLDFELEVGFLSGPENKLGQPVPIDKANDHIFGLVLMNDWSARDIQKWEYQPLGPFLAKNWGTSVSPWVVTLEALQPFRAESPSQHPEPLPYLNSDGRSAFDIQLEVYLKTEKLDQPHKICTSNYRNLYWSIEQQLAHHTVNGCNVRTGDLFGSGTISGSEKDSYGSMLELAWMGTDPVKLPNGEERNYLEDGDEVIMTGFGQGNGYRVGFGEVRGKILPAFK
ncbi:MAG: fumarylacetoacetase [Gracilimonas sp.]|nr:fumarylacetoacetase [Gracilimonas sp.]